MDDNMERIEGPGYTMLFPYTLEEMMVAIGEKELDENVDIVTTTEFMADLATRILRLEDKRGQV